MSLRSEKNRFKEIVDRVKPLSEARFVTFHALGEPRSSPQGQKHYVESIDTASLLDPEQEILMTPDKDGKPLSLDRGAPLRVVAPHRLGNKSIKYVQQMEFSKERRLSWWTLVTPIYDWRAYVNGGRRKK